MYGPLHPPVRHADAMKDPTPETFRRTTYARGVESFSAGSRPESRSVEDPTNRGGPTPEGTSRLGYALMICFTASTIFGASGRSQLIIAAAPGPGTSGKAIFRTLRPGTSCTTSAMTCEP